MENDEKGLRRYSIRLPHGESTVRAEAITFALSEKGAWLTNLNGLGANPYVPGLVEADVRDLTAGEEAWGHDANAAEGFEPSTFPAVVAFVERGGKSGLARAIPQTAVGWLRLRGWVVSAAWLEPERVSHCLWHLDIDSQLVNLSLQDVEEVARLMGWQG